MNLRLSLSDGEMLLDRLLQDGVDIAHDCGGALACASCRVIVREGADRLAAPSDDELDMLERAGENEPAARLACQVKHAAADLEIEIPRCEAPRLGLVVPLSVSAGAAMHFAAQLAGHPRALGVRLSVRPAGCSGFRYRVDAAEVIGETDTVFESSGVRIVVDASSLPYLQGTFVHLAEKGLSRQLRFDNPNARAHCGCGESFGIQSL